MTVLSPRHRDRLIAHVYAADRRHVQVALYGCAIVQDERRQTVTWREALYADTGQPLGDAEEEYWRDDLVAAVLSKAVDY